MAAAAPAPIEARWIDTKDEWARLRERWDDVVLAGARPSVFLTWDFLECAWLHFAGPQGSSLAVIGLYEGDRLVGLSPFRLSVRRRFGLPVRHLGILAGWESDRVPPLAAPSGREAACAAAALGCLEAQARRWDHLELREVSVSEPFCAALRDWGTQAGRRLTEQVTSPSPYVLLEPGQDVLLGLGSATRQGLRRHRRKLEAEGGPCELEAFDTPERIAHGLELYLELEKRSWKGAAQQGIGKNERNRRFYRDLLPRLAAHGRAVVSLLLQKGHALAGGVDLRLGDTAYGSHWTFDQAFAQFSPGNLHKSLSLEWHAAHGARRYEMYAQFLGNKMRWATGQWDNATLHVTQTRGLRRSLLFALGRARARISSRRSEVVAAPTSEVPGESPATSRA
jgi:CelD/BcsL family acetyltransferase involved in cellulose biosynthesis